MVQRKTKSYELPVTDSCSWRRIYIYHLPNKAYFCSSPDTESLLQGFQWKLNTPWNDPFFKCLEFFILSLNLHFYMSLCTMSFCTSVFILPLRGSIYGLNISGLHAPSLNCLFSIINTPSFPGHSEKNIRFPALLHPNCLPLNVFQFV